MALGFIFGDELADHQAAVVKQIKRWQEQDDAAQIFYLVPNHVKFASEVTTLAAMNASKDEIFASLAVQVFSLTRLAWYFMKNDALYNQPRLDDAGAGMVVQRILQEHAAELQIYRRQHQQGFIKRLVGQLAEFSQSNLMPADFAMLADKLDANTTGDLKAKLADLNVIYTAFLQKTAGQYLTSQDILPALANQLSQLDLRHAYFILSDFTQFTAQELAVVLALIDNAAAVVVDLKLATKPTRQLPRSDLFYQPTQLYFQLIQHAATSHVPLLVDQVASIQRPTSTGILRVKQWFERRFSAKSSKIIAENDTSVTLTVADSRISELRQVASKIRELVANAGYSYRDILVQARHLSSYHNIIAPVFDEYDIPVFVDLEQKMAQHPLADMVLALFAVKANHFAPRDVMQLLKSELLLPDDMDVAAFRTAVDLCENCLLKFGIRSQKAWQQEQDWQFNPPVDGRMKSTAQAEIDEQINCVRHFVAATLPPFFEKLDAAKTGRDAVVALVTFLKNARVDQVLATWVAAADAAGDVAAAQRPQQVWDNLMHLLDEYVKNLGDMPFDLDEFTELLRAGLADAAFKRVPATLDAVAISEYTMVQPSNIKVNFVLDATDTQMPALEHSPSLLGDSDRDNINALLAQVADESTNLQYINESTQYILANEPYVAYTTLLCGKDKLFISYASQTTATQDNAQRLSPYVSALVDELALPVAKISATPKMTTPLIESAATTRQSLMRTLFAMAQTAKQVGETPTPEWAAALTWLSQQHGYQDVITRLTAALDYHNQPRQLSQPSVRGLYFQDNHGLLEATYAASVSRLEDYFKNPFELFLNNGLKLRERATFKLDALIKGTYYHAALDGLVKAINQQTLPLEKMKWSQITDLLAATLRRLDEQVSYRILKNDDRMNYWRLRLKTTLMQMAWLLKQTTMTSRFNPIATEIQFGMKNADWQPLSWDVGEFQRVVLRGKIDRIDVAQIDGDKTGYFNIVDYKSANKDVDLGQVMFGLQLQLLAYMQVAIAHRQDLLKMTPQLKQLKPSGLVYSHISNIALQEGDANQETALVRAAAKQNKYNGLWLADPQVSAQLVDGEALFPFKLKKDNSAFYQSTPAATPEELAALLLHNRDLITKAVQAIFAGDIRLAPYKLSDRTNGLTNSIYQDVMMFDAMMGNTYRQVTSVTPKAGLAQLVEKYRAQPERLAAMLRQLGELKEEDNG